MCNGFKSTNPSNYTLFESLSEHVEKNTNLVWPTCRKIGLSDQNEKKPLCVKNQNGCAHGDSVHLTRWRFIGCFLIFYACKLQNKHFKRSIVTLQNEIFQNNFSVKCLLLIRRWTWLILHMTDTKCKKGRVAVLVPKCLWLGKLARADTFGIKFTVVNCVIFVKF